MRGLTGSLGGMGTQALASGLEELKRTAGAGLLQTTAAACTAHSSRIAAGVLMKVKQVQPFSRCLRPQIYAA
jgi:hypothetical protein